MKVPWPPTEETGWRLTPLKTNTKRIFLPVLPLEQAYVAIRCLTQDPVQVELTTRTSRSFLFEIPAAEWTVLPYPIESHTLGVFWDTLNTSIECTIEIASFQWNLRQYRMRVFLNEEGYMICAYKYNKNAQLISQLPYEDKPFKATEDGYVLYPKQVKASAELFGLGREFCTKKLPEDRYFPWRKNGAKEKATNEGRE